MARATAARVEVRVLDPDAPGLSPAQWNRLVERSAVPVGHMTWEFQRAWWESLGRGEPLLLAAERDGEVVAIAPFYVDYGMVTFAGTCFEFDYLDFVGDVSDPVVLEALLGCARECVSEFVGFELYFVSDRSPTGRALREAAPRLGLSCHIEDDMLAPELDLVTDRAAAVAFANRKSVLKLERFFARGGDLQVQHLSEGDEILPHLPAFFEQHTARHSDESNPSRFFKPKARRLFEQLAVCAGKTGRLRFVRIDWDGRPIAFHYGHSYAGRYFFGVCSFDPALAKRSPGKLLLRHLILGAIDEGAHTFDFGTGDQEFKRELATRITGVRTYGLYPTRRQADGR